MLFKEKYTYSVERKKGKKLNPHLIVSVYQTNENGEKIKISQYDRDHHDFFNTFFPFRQDNKDYALISKHYSKTSIIELPSCKMVAEEPWSLKESLCPMDFYVLENNPTIGFVAGCRYNDDTTYKIEYLDLTNITRGKILRDNRFGYIELSEGIRLKDAIQHTVYNNKDSTLDIAVNLTFNMVGQLVNKESLVELLKANGYIVFNKKRVIKEL